jgi:type IV pilus assembly protein PilB
MYRVLIIDDDPKICFTIKLWLESDGGKIVRVQNHARRGLISAFRSRPELIILDYEMPGMDGLAVLEKLGRWKRTRLIPVIMLTGNQEPKTEESAMYQYAERFLTKPVSREALLECVNRTLRIFYQGKSL